MKQSDPENSLKAQFVIFRCQKYVKKGYMEMGEQLYLEPLKGAPGRSVFHYYLLLKWVPMVLAKDKNPYAFTYILSLVSIEYIIFVILVLFDH